MNLSKIKKVKEEENLFKLEVDVAYPQICIYSRYFKTLKHLNQWLKRNKDIWNVGTRKYILTDNGYELFHIFGNTIVPMSELEKSLSLLQKEEARKKEFVDYLKNQSIQNTKNEESEYSV